MEKHINEMAEAIHSVTKEDEEVLRNKAPVSVQLKREKEKTRDLMVAVKILGMGWVAWFCITLLMAALGFRSDRFFRSNPVCPASDYNLCLPLPVPVPTPTK